MMLRVGPHPRLRLSGAHMMMAKEVSHDVRYPSSFRRTGPLYVRRFAVGANRPNRALRAERNRSAPGALAPTPLARWSLTDPCRVRELTSKPHNYSFDYVKLAHQEVNGLQRGAKHVRSRFPARRRPTRRSRTLRPLRSWSAVRRSRVQLISFDGDRHRCEGLSPTLDPSGAHRPAPASSPRHPSGQPRHASERRRGVPPEIVRPLTPESNTVWAGTRRSQTS